MDRGDWEEDMGECVTDYTCMCVTWQLGCTHAGLWISDLRSIVHVDVT